MQFFILKLGLAKLVRIREKIFLTKFLKLLLHFATFESVLKRKFAMFLDTPVSL